jgi:hypothetical protein
MATLVTPGEMERFRALGFSVCFPYNHDPDLWEAVAPYAEVVDEIYADLHPEVFPALRTWTWSESAEEHLDALCRLLDQASEARVALNVVLNTIPSAPLDEGRLFGSLRRLMEHGEVRATLADMVWAQKIRAELPALPMSVSTVSEVDSQHAANLWRDLTGIDTVVPDRNINKLPRRLRQIRELGVRVKLVVSDLCMFDCPTRFRHYQLHGHQGGVTCGDEADQPYLYCRSIKARVPAWHWVKKEILPFQLPRYEGILDVVKLIDRNLPTAINLDIMARYIRMESDVHPVYGYREPAESFDRLDRCDRACVSCGWCAEHVETVHPPRIHGPFIESAYLAEGGPEAVALRGGGGLRLPQEPAGGRGAGPAPTGPASLLAVRAALEAEGAAELLQLLSMTAQRLKPYLADGRALGNDFRFHAVARHESDGVAIEWRRGDERMVTAVIQGTAAAPVAFHVGWAGVYHTGAGGPDETKRFAEVARELRQRMRG